MREITERMSVGVKRRHLVTMRKVSLSTLSMSRVCALRHQAGAHYSAVEWIRDKAAVHNVLAPAPHPDPQVALAAKRAWIVFCAMPQNDDDT